ncbi:retrovirus-related pol polyprotein from transposon TNT 1-94 [Tanacetum coccineum]
MEAAVQQCYVDKQCFEIHKKELFLNNDRLLHQIMYQDVMLCVMNSTTVVGDSVNVEMQSSESCDKCCDLDVELLKNQNAYNELLKSYSQLEKHCVSLELSMQLNQEIFKTQLQAKDTTIRKLKEHIKSMRENDKEEKVKHDIDKIETINIELEHSQIQEKVFVITSLKNNLRKLKGKEIVENVARIPNATTIDPRMFKLDLDPLSPRLLKNRDAHIDYLKYTQEQAYIIQGIVEQAKAKQPLDNALEFTSNLVPPKEITSHSVETQKPEIKVYSRRPKQVKSVGSRDTNLYTISLDDMLKTSSICLLSKASKTKSWLWHRLLSYLNFGTLNKLAKDGLARGIPKLKFKKDHLCSACALGKSKKSSHQPNTEDTNQEKLYLLHMDLCVSMCVESINGKKYILVIVDDYL